jgi:succinoglycan biosynthesis protein ExoM
VWVSAAVELSIVIPTFRRPAALRRCVDSCFTQTGLDGLDYELVIVDNCPQQSARDVVASMARAATLRIIYAHEPRPGVSHARNCGVATAHAPLIGFIDDDELAEPNWMAHLLAAQAKFDADVVFGPVLAVIEEDCSADRDFVRDFYTEDCQRPSGPITGLAYSGNVLLRKERCFRGGHAFNPQLGSFGAEDALFFLQLGRTDVSMVWCREAVTHEIVPPPRTTYAYMLNRSIIRGQSTPLIYSMLRPPEWRSVAWFMMAGAVQFLIFGLAAACAAPNSRPPAMRAASRALMGLGKVLWISPFRIFNHYGPPRSPGPI